MTLQPLADTEVAGDTGVACCQPVLWGRGPPILGGLLEGKSGQEKEATQSLRRVKASPLEQRIQHPPSTPGSLGEQTTLIW